MSIKKLVLFIVVGLLFIGGITLAAWEEGRVGLFSGFGLKGYKRREADGLMVASKGKKPDFKEAFRLYQLDADKGDGVALRKIGEMYRDGRGVPQSDSKARESWVKAAAPATSRRSFGWLISIVPATAALSRSITPKASACSDGPPARVMPLPRPSLPASC